MLGGGDLIAAGTDKPETYDVLMYTNSLEYATAIIKGGETSLSPRKDFDTSTFTDPVIRGFRRPAEELRLFRFDGAET